MGGDNMDCPSFLDDDDEQWCSECGRKLIDAWNIGKIIDFNGLDLTVCDRCA